MEALGSWVEQQRWYASKSRHIAGIEIEEWTQVAGDPTLVLGVVQARFATGNHELYQIPTSCPRSPPRRTSRC